MKLAQALKEDAFRRREVIKGRDARTLPEDPLEMSQAEFSAGFPKSPMKRAKLAGMQRNATLIIDTTDGALHDN